MNLCCFFNYAPLYRRSIYEKIDKEFETQFYFGREVIDGKVSGIPSIDYSILRKKPITFKNKVIFKFFQWRTKCWYLPFKRYDTFLVTGDFVYSYIPFIILAKIMGKRVYGWGHGIKNRKSKSIFLHDFFYRNITGFFSYGEGGKERLIELGYDPQKIHVIYNSLNEKCEDLHLKSDVYKTHFGNNFPTLIFIGRLTPQKRLDWLLLLLKNLEEDGVLCNLVFVGTGPCSKNLKDQTSKLKLENRVWFYGECYNTSVTDELLYNADLCVSPGNVGLTALSSMQCGTPVITHNDFETQMPEYETIENWRTGCLYKKDDFSDFSEKVKKWLHEFSDRRQEVRNNCYAMINGKWNSDNQIEILKSVLL